MATVHLSAQFQRDFDAIILRLAEDAGRPVAIDYAERIRICVNRLVTHPGIGAPRRKFGADARILIVSPYLIFYDGAPKAVTVTVLRILHESRRITAKMILKGRDDLDS